MKIFTLHKFEYSYLFAGNHYRECNSHCHCVSCIDSLRWQNSAMCSWHLFHCC